MIHRYSIARNVFTISVADGLEAWEKLEPRFGLFEATTDERPVLEIEIKEGTIGKTEVPDVYRPKFLGVGLIEARYWRGDDGDYVMEFKHVKERSTRIIMTMTERGDRAEIVISPRGDGNDPYQLSHALMIAFMMGVSGNGTLLFHSSTVVYDGRAYLFQGKSGTGKSTHASLWTANVEGAELLNDDHPLVRFSDDGTPIAYGSPWSGKTDCYRNESAPLGAIVRIIRGEENELHRIKGLKAFVSVTPSVFYIPFMSSEQRDMRSMMLERLVTEVKCCEMYCRPDKDAALTCMRGVTAMEEE